MREARARATRHDSKEPFFEGKRQIAIKKQPEENIQFELEQAVTPAATYVLLTIAQAHTLPKIFAVRSINFEMAIAVLFPFLWQDYLSEYKLRESFF
ncbi:hypothetical protein B7486_49895 [cyanobacterium TDX16]|nr:hypothetical protein B7486_49895 [cyanobacterium TDX16]